MGPGVSGGDRGLERSPKRVERDLDSNHTLTLTKRPAGGFSELVVGLIRGFGETRP